MFVWCIGHEGDIEVPRALSFMELAVMGKAKSRIWKNARVLMVQGETASEIGNTDKLKDISRRLEK